MSDKIDPYKDVPFLYAAKAPRSERDKGCEGLYFKYSGQVPEPITEGEYEALHAAGERVVTGNCHSTVKPIEIMEWLIEKYSDPGDTVLDPFAGSGTTGIAAMLTGRSAHLIEMDGESPGVYQSIITGRLHGWRNEMMRELPPQDRPRVRFEGALPESDPRDDVPDEFSVADLFGFGMQE